MNNRIESQIKNYTQHIEENSYDVEALYNVPSEMLHSTLYKTLLCAYTRQLYYSMIETAKDIHDNTDLSDISAYIDKWFECYAPQYKNAYETVKLEHLKTVLNLSSQDLNLFINIRINQSTLATSINCLEMKPIYLVDDRQFVLKTDEHNMFVYENIDNVWVQMLGLKKLVYLVSKIEEPDLTEFITLKRSELFNIYLPVVYSEASDSDHLINIFKIYADLNNVQIDPTKKDIICLLKSMDVSLKQALDLYTAHQHPIESCDLPHII